MKKLEELYRAYAKDVYYFALSCCRDRELAKDVLQSTFLAALTSLQSYRGKSSVRTWLFGIARHKLADLTAARDAALHSLDEAVAQHFGQSLDEHLDQRRLLETVRLVVETFDEPAKEIFYLRVCVDLSFAQIADVVGKSENTCRVCFYRTKQKLVRLLKERGEME